MLNKKYILLPAALFCALCLSGCNKSNEDEIALASFSTSVEDFTKYMKDAEEKINMLDVEQKESVDELLSILEGMNDKVAAFCNVAPPSQYVGITNPLNTASEHMSSAVSYYHSAYESDTFNENDASVAYQHYQISMKWIRIAGYMIAGDEIPDDEHVTVYEETNDSHILDKWLDGDKAEDAEDSETAPETTSEAVE
ncbi:MAG: hypothetical protein K2N73_11580 [Lachnospiraceae bacterium]|nr:hypothetical protein [Lachnospiraceae bacterium]